LILFYSSFFASRIPNHAQQNHTKMPSIAKRNTRPTKPTMRRKRDNDEISDEESSAATTPKLSFFPTEPVAAGSPNDPPPPSIAVSPVRHQWRSSGGEGDDGDDDWETVGSDDEGDGEGNVDTVSVFGVLKVYGASD